MKTAKLFQNGNSQAVRLPKAFSFSGNRVYLKKVGNAVILLPYEAPWQSLVDSLALFAPDFMETRVQPDSEPRPAAFD